LTGGASQKRLRDSIKPEPFCEIRTHDNGYFAFSSPSRQGAFVLGELTKAWKLLENAGNADPLVIRLRQPSRRSLAVVAPRLETCC
jgi:hypothetical protein